MNATKIKEIVLPALAKFWAKLKINLDEFEEVVGNKVTELETKVNSFEVTVNEIEDLLSEI